jgi:hypothetical protein
LIIASKLLFEVGLVGTILATGARGSWVFTASITLIILWMLVGLFASMDRLKEPMDENPYYKRWCNTANKVAFYFREWLAF